MAKPPKTTQRRIIFTARIVVSVALMAYLATKIHWDQAFPRRPHFSTFVWFGLGILVTLGGIWASAWRWQRVLEVFDIRVPVARLLSISLAGMFVGNVLPSTIGGDVLRISRCTRESGARESVFASVVLERLTGWIVLPVISLVGFALWPGLITKENAWVALLVGGIAVLLLSTMMILAASTRLGGRFREHQNWMRFIGAIHLGVDRMRREPAETCWLLVAAFAYQCTTIATVFCAVHTVGARVPIAAVIAFTPAVAMVQVLPISLSGLGVREGMFALLFHGLGVPTGKSVAIGLCWYAITLIASVAGGPAFAIGNRSRSAEEVRT
jgi:hypothetical protein